MDRSGYHSYLLRLWRAGKAEDATWNASLEDIRTREVIGFHSLQDLCAHLRGLVGQAPDAMPGRAEDGKLDNTG